MKSVAVSITRLRSIVGISLTLAAALATAAYPEKPVRFVVPYGPGGATDIVARSIAVRLSDAWGQSVIVDNRGGAGGIVGSEVVARAAPDGYTVLLATTANAAQVAMHSKLPFDLLRDFAPVTQLIEAPFVLTANPKVAGSLKELIATAKAKPGALNYATVGGSNSLMMEMVKSMSGTDITAVPYKGVGPALIDLTAGRVHMMFFSIGVAQPYVKDGRLRALGVTTLKRVPVLPGVPSISETLPGYELTPWYGVLVPARTPRQIIDKLHADMTRILKLPEIQESYMQQGFLPVGSTPQAFAAHMRSEITKFQRIVKDAKLKPE